MAAMFAAGVERCFEFGPGGVLKGLTRRNDRKKTCASLATVEDVKKAAAELSVAAG
jgi:malonyl CoA-acyl carrier protein transacylase